MVDDSVLDPALVPVRFKSVLLTDAVLVKTTGPVPEESNVLVPVSVNCRLMLLPAPTYWSVVASARTRFDAALLDAPMALGEPPSAIPLMRSTPAETVVGPV